MSDVVLKVEGISKQYRLGELGTGTISHDLNRWWYKVRGKEDPYLKLGDVNDRSVAGGSKYVWSLRDINLELKQGEVLGVIGKNGAGKSTLLKILSQVTTPTTGQVKVKGRIAALLEVGTGFHPDLTGRENIFLNGAILGMSKAEIKSKLDEIIDFSGVAKYVDTPVKRYSSGMMVRLGFAVAAHLEPEILIVDEVLAVGDAEFQEKCLGKMKDVSSQGRTVLFVSHNLGAVKQLCTKAMLLENGALNMLGSTTDVINKYFAIDDEKLFRGEIPRDYKRAYSNGKAYFNSAYAIDKQGNYTDKLYFKQTLRIKISVEFMTEVKDAGFSISILNDEMQKISYYEYPEDDKIPFEFTRGIYELVFTFDDSFLPGKYYLSPCVMHRSGLAIDYIERVAEFEVSQFSEDGVHKYKWNEKHGNSYMKLKQIDITKR
jgi:lipopolysaccharide transport system ATP-binding protein